MPLNPGGSEGNEDGAADNEGPHCRNCHIGASSCNQCHGVKDNGDPGWYFATRTGTGSNQTKEYEWVSSSGTNTTLPGGYGNPYMTQQYVHTSAVAGLNGQCVDGGFSWPHRTLGANLLKDELYGVDFDGDRVYVSDVRGVGLAGSDNANVIDNLYNYMTDVYGSGINHPYGTDLDEGNDARVLINPSASTSITAGALVENLDSACIDCHGDATFWNGDDSDYFYSKTYYGGVVGGGWEVHLKGLP